MFSPSTEIRNDISRTCRALVVVHASHGVVHGVAEVTRFAINAAQVDTGLQRLSEQEGQNGKGQNERETVRSDHETFQVREATPMCLRQSDHVIKNGRDRHFTRTPGLHA